MKGEYDDVIIEASRILADAIIEREEGLGERPAEIDWDVKLLLWRLGLAVMAMIYAALSSQVVEAGRQRGLTVDRRLRIGIGTVFGRVEMESPYMRNKATGETARPVRERLGFRNGSRTLGVERALTDFGAEESFALAAHRFEEHYHHEVGHAGCQSSCAEPHRDIGRRGDRHPRGPTSPDQPVKISRVAGGEHPRWLLVPRLPYRNK